jgi:STE24 endopeptidase
VWAAAAFFLWDSTKVPGWVHMSGLDVKAFFTAKQLHDGRIFERFFWFNSLLATLAALVVFAIYARYGSRFTRESAAGPIGTGMMLAMLGFGLVWLVGLPFTLASLWWARRHGESHMKYQDVIFGGWLALGVNFAFLCVAVLIAMGFARIFGQRWWLPAATVFVLLFALRIFIAPYLITPGTHHLSSPAYDRATFTGADLQRDFERLRRKEGVTGLPVRVQNVSDDEKSANAFTVGFGPSKKVFLWDTLLQPPFSRGQINFTMAHEIGHQARYHLVKAIGWYALFTFPFAYLIAVAARRRGGLGRPEAIPLAIFLVVLLNTLSTPFQAAITRHMEQEADWMALRATRDPASGQELFQNFAKTSLGDPSPPTWAYLWFEDHPTLAQRVAQIREFAAREHLPVPPGGS